MIKKDQETEECNSSEKDIDLKIRNDIKGLQAPDYIIDATSTVLINFIQKHKTNNEEFSLNDFEFYSFLTSKIIENISIELIKQKEYFNFKDISNFEFINSKYYPLFSKTDLPNYTKKAIINSIEESVKIKPLKNIDYNKIYSFCISVIISINNSMKNKNK